MIANDCAKHSRSNDKSLFPSALGLHSGFLKPFGSLYDMMKCDAVHRPNFSNTVLLHYRGDPLYKLMPEAIQVKVLIYNNYSSSFELLFEVVIVESVGRG